MSRIWLGLVLTTFGVGLSLSVNAPIATGQEAEEIERVVEEAAESLEKAGDEVAEKLERIAEKFAERIEEWAGENEEEWEELGEKLGSKFESFAKDQEKRWGKWESEFSQNMEKWTRQMDSEDFDADKLKRMINQGLDLIGEMPVDETFQGLVDQAKNLDDIDIKQFEELGEIISEAVEEAQSEIENLELDNATESDLKELIEGALSQFQEQGKTIKAEQWQSQKVEAKSDFQSPSDARRNTSPAEQLQQNLKELDVDDATRRQIEALIQKSMQKKEDRKARREKQNRSSAKESTSKKTNLSDKQIMDSIAGKIRAMAKQKKLPKGSLSLQLTVENGVVTLEGSAASARVRQIVIDAAKRADGVSQVISRIKMKEKSDKSDEPKSTEADHTHGDEEAEARGKRTAKTKKAARAKRVKAAASAATPARSAKAAPAKPAKPATPAAPAALATPAAPAAPAAKRADSAKPKLTGDEAAKAIEAAIAKAKSDAKSKSDEIKKRIAEQRIKSIQQTIDQLKKEVEMLKKSKGKKK